jgi:hypothetical protein
MKTILSVLFIVLFSLGSINAQNKMSLGAGLVVSFPMGDFSESANTGFGGTAIFELGFMPQLVGIGQIGYVSWGTEAEGFSYSAVPILVGVKYFFIPGIGFYGTGQLGLSIFSIETPSVSVPFLGEVSGGSVSSTEFTFVIGAGYQLPVGSNVYLDFNGTFNLISDLSNIQLWAGAKFGL